MDSALQQEVVLWIREKVKCQEVLWIRDKVEWQEVLLELEASY